MTIFNYLLIVVCLIMSACTTETPIKVTVPSQKVTLPPEPHYPIKDLRSGDSTAKVVKAYVATVRMQQDRIEILEHARGGCV